MAQLLDQSLDEIISQSGESSNGGGRYRRGRGRGGYRGRRSFGDDGDGGGAGPVRSPHMRNTRRFSSSPYASSRSGNQVWSHDLFEGDEQRSDGRSDIHSRLSDPNVGTKVIVRNLHENVSSNDIRELFGSMGAISRAEVEYDRSGRSLGSAVVIFSKRRDAESAVEKYNGVLLDNQAMDIFIVERRSGPNLRIGTSSDGHRRVILSSSRGGGGYGGGRGGGFRGGRGPRGGRGGARRDKKIPTKEELDQDLTSYTSTGMQMMDINA